MLFSKKHFYLECPHRNNRKTLVGTINAGEVNGALLTHSLSSATQNCFVSGSQWKYKCANRVEECGGRP